MAGSFTATSMDDYMHSFLVFMLVPVCIEGAFMLAPTGRCVYVYNMCVCVCVCVWVCVIGK